MRKFKLRNKVSNKFSKKLPKGLKNNPIFRFPRNQKCFCGSKIKFKKCCFEKMPLYITDKEATDLEKALKEIGL